MYKLTLTFTNSDSKYLVGIADSQEAADDLALKILKERAYDKVGQRNFLPEEINNMHNCPIMDDKYKYSKKYLFDSYAGGPCSLYISPLQSTTFFIQLEGDAKYQL